MTAHGFDLAPPKDVNIQINPLDNPAGQVFAVQTPEALQQLRQFTGRIGDTAHPYLPSVGIEQGTGDGGSFSERNISGWDTKTWRDASGRIVEKDMRDSSGNEIDSSYKYDAQTGKMVEHVTSDKNAGGTSSQSHVEKFDGATGERTSNVLTGRGVNDRGQVTTTEADYDPRTNKLTHDRMVATNATIDHNYNPFTGIIESAEYSANDGSKKIEDKFDSRGRRKTETEIDADGEEKELVFDPVTQRQLYSSK